ncbi:MAG: hypothetical protein LJE68_06860 [Rhodobacter sp.]|nr:hypothetical protein [Rhodobacter sp.]
MPLRRLICPRHYFAQPELARKWRNVGGLRRFYQRLMTNFDLFGRSRRPIRPDLALSGCRAAGADRMRHVSPSAETCRKSRTAIFGRRRALGAGLAQHIVVPPTEFTILARLWSRDSLWLR